MDKVHDAGMPVVLFIVWLLFAAAMGALVFIPPRAAREPAVLSENEAPKGLVENIEVLGPSRPRARAGATAGLGR